MSVFRAYRLLAAPFILQLLTSIVTSRSKTRQAPVRSSRTLLNSLDHLLIRSQDVTTRGEYYPDKAMATAAVSLPSTVVLLSATNTAQSPPLYLRVTSTSKEGLEAAVKQINDLMDQELPDLVDQRRFRRREPEQFERDEFGRVCSIIT